MSLVLPMVLPFVVIAVTVVVFLVPFGGLVRVLRREGRVDRRALVWLIIVDVVALLVGIFATVTNGVFGIGDPWSYVGLGSSPLWFGDLSKGLIAWGWPVLPAALAWIGVTIALGIVSRPHPTRWLAAAVVYAVVLLVVPAVVIAGADVVTQTDPASVEGFVVIGGWHLIGWIALTAPASAAATTIAAASAAVVRARARSRGALFAR